MFSDVVVLHGEESSSPSCSPNVDRRNVCSSEKTTQAGDGNIWQIPSVPNQQQILQTQQQIAQDCCDLRNGEAMTCQELLALGAINAALPTGQIVLDTFFSELTKGISHRNKNTGDFCLQQQQQQQQQQFSDDDFSCCQDLWHCESEYKNETRSRLYVICCLVLKAIIRSVRWIRRKIKQLVEHKYFQQGILLAILINTLSMGIEYHKQPEYLTHLVETSNIIFSAIFAVEMLLKITADGLFGYISNGFNVFDGIIVILR